MLISHALCKYTFCKVLLLKATFVEDTFFALVTSPTSSGGIKKTLRYVHVGTQEWEIR